MALLYAFRTCRNCYSIGKSSTSLPRIECIASRHIDWAIFVDSARMRQRRKSTHRQLFVVRLFHCSRYVSHIARHWCILWFLQWIGEFFIGLFARHRNEFVDGLAQLDHQFHNCHRTTRQSIRNGLQWNTIFPDHHIYIYGDSGCHQNLLSHLFSITIDQLLRIFGHPIWQRYSHIRRNFIHHSDVILYSSLSVRTGHRIIKSNWTKHKTCRFPYLSCVHFLFVARRNESSSDCRYLSSNYLGPIDFGEGENTSLIQILSGNGIGTFVGVGSWTWI